MTSRIVSQKRTEFVSQLKIDNNETRFTHYFAIDFPVDEIRFSPIITTPVVTPITIPTFSRIIPYFLMCDIPEAGTFVGCGITHSYRAADPLPALVDIQQDFQQGSLPWVSHVVKNPLTVRGLYTFSYAENFIGTLNCDVIITFYVEFIQYQR